MRKVKFTQDSFDEKLGAILEEFPISIYIMRLYKPILSTIPHRQLSFYSLS